MISIILVLLIYITWKLSISIQIIQSLLHFNEHWYTNLWAWLTREGDTYIWGHSFFLYLLNYLVSNALECEFGRQLLGLFSRMRGERGDVPLSVDDDGRSELRFPSSPAFDGGLINRQLIPCFHSKILQPVLVVRVVFLFSGLKSKRK